MFENVFGTATEGVREALANMLLLNLLIAVISMVFIESIKVSFEKMIFKKNKPPTAFKWLLSLVVVIIVTLLTMGLFEGGVLTLSHWPMILLTIISSWSLTTLGYVLIIKMIFSGFKILYNRALEYETDSVAASLEANRKKVKTRILLEEELCLAELRKADIQRKLKALEAGEDVPVPPPEKEEE